MTTWNELVKEARESLESDHPDREDRDTLREWEDTGEWHDAAHEYADGHHRVIYYSESRALFAAGLLDEYEDEAKELGPVGGFDSVDDWLTAAAYCALRTAFMEAVSAYLEDHEDETVEA
jgi:hypothetical protein